MMGIRLREPEDGNHVLGVAKRKDGSSLGYWRQQDHDTVLDYPPTGFFYVSQKVNLCLM